MMTLKAWAEKNNFNRMTATKYIQIFSVKISRANPDNIRSEILLNDAAQHHLKSIFEAHAKEIAKRNKQIQTMKIKEGAEIFTTEERQERCKRWCKAFRGLIPAPTIKSWFKDDYELLDPEPMCFKEE